MKQITSLRIFNTIGIAAILIFGYLLFTRINNPMSRYYGHNMIVEADDLNVNLMGKEIEEGLIFRNAEIDGSNFILNVEDLNQLPKNNEEMSDSLYTKLCGLLLNSGDVDLSLTNFIWKIRQSRTKSFYQISMNKDSCMKVGYRPVTG